jgi:pyridoxamine 5'-phosphate oxidase
MTTTDPFAKFDTWFREAQESEPSNSNAMTLATVSSAGRPSTRVVLLKDHDPQGFVFYTNFNSQKGRELLANPHASLCFYWKSLDRQIRIEGVARPVADDEADAYYASRPRGSRIGAWASEQSRSIASRDLLEERVAELTKKYEGAEIPRPPHWSGFRVVPDRIEFWTNRESRLHDREVFLRDGEAWTELRLQP